MRQPFLSDPSAYLRAPRRESRPVQDAYAIQRPSFCRVCELGHKAVGVFAAAVFFGMVVFAIFG